MGAQSLIGAGRCAGDCGGGIGTTSAIAQQFSRFSAVGSTLEARRAHTATLLADGTVLIVGGKPQGCCGDTATFASAELFEASSGRFSSAGTLTNAGALHTPTLLLDGRVLIAAGEDVQVVPSDAYSVAVTILRKQAELYDPKTGGVAATGAMAVAHASHTATLLPNGNVLLTGG